MSERHDTVVIGGGQAGLAMSHVLSERGREHIVLESHRVAERWRAERWDSLRFQFPNWSLKLPGYAYAGGEPDAFAHFTEIARLLEGYATASGAPVRDHTEVVALEPASNGRGFVLRTTDGVIAAERVVIATGPFQRPVIPSLAARLPPSVHQIDPTRYRGPSELPAGAVLVVGSGASGCQIADELHHAGRTVFLAVSRHRRAPRTLLGHDLYWWLEKLGRFDQTIDSFPGRKPPPSVIVTGIAGGYDVDVRRFAADGMTVLGRLVDAQDGTLRFDASANEVLDEADRAYAEFVSRVSAAAAGIEGADDKIANAIMPPFPRAIPSIDSLNLGQENVATVIWATGYGFDYGWVRLPVFDANGRPRQRRGISDTAGLYFVGLHWMHTIRSGLLSGVGEDAAFLADHFERRQV